MIDLAVAIIILDKIGLSDAWGGIIIGVVVRITVKHNNTLF
jgi:hypothetical protein